MPALGLPFEDGGGLLGRDDEPNRDPGRDCVGGGGRGADGGGAGGPRPTTGIPRSSSGSDERVLTPPFCMLNLDPDRLGGGKGD